MLSLSQSFPFVIITIAMNCKYQQYLSILLILWITLDDIPWSFNFDRVTLPLARGRFQCGHSWCSTSRYTWNMFDLSWSKVDLFRTTFRSYFIFHYLKFKFFSFFYHLLIFFYYFQTGFLSVIIVVCINHPDFKRAPNNKHLLVWLEIAFNIVVQTIVSKG